MSKSKLNITDLEYAFKLEPKEMIEFFNSKGLQTSYNWYEVYEEAQAKAFTVAKMTQLDLLKDTKDLTAQAIKKGWGKGEYQARANELFKKKGWSGFKTVTDKEGNEKQIELGTPRRIKNIYHSNMVSAQAASRYKQQLEDVDIAPYFQYQCTLDGRTRPEHRAMHGKVFRYDDPIWASLYPPNGWGCRCSVRSLTESELNRMGIKPEKSEGHLHELPLLEERVGGEVSTQIQDKTIQAYDFELGGKQFTLKADPGWNYNVGTHAWNIDVQAWNKVKDMPTEVKDRFISEMAQNPHRGKYYKAFIDRVLKDMKTGISQEPISWLSPKLFTFLQKENANISSPVLVMQDDRIGHLVGGRQKIDKDTLYEVYDIVQNYDAVYYDYTTPNVKSIAFIKNIPNTEYCYKVCFKLGFYNKKQKDLVNFLSTVGKVKQANMLDTKLFKKIE